MLTSTSLIGVLGVMFFIKVRGISVDIEKRRVLYAIRKIQCL